MSKSTSKRNGGITMAPMAPIPPVKLTLQLAEQLGGAIQRLKELQSITIVTTENDAERIGLEQFVETTLKDNALELLGAWFTIQTEYQPLVRAATGFMLRVSATQARAQQQAAAVASPENSPT